MDFEHLTYDRQLDHLREEMAAGRPPEELLEACAGIRDYAPLAWLAGELLGQGWLGEAEHREFFADYLLERPDTTVQGVVDEMVERSRDGEGAEDLRATLLDALRRAPLERLPAVSILDRALNHQFPGARERFLDGIHERVSRAIRAGRIEELPERIFAHVSGSVLPDLRSVAEREGHAEEFEAVRRRAAERAVDVLGDVPKGVSQSNAEELLSSRVYTDPGHFLMELLQNAEDAGASHWRVDFESDRIVVVHDGDPFDFGDVVGITSIGQTTKSDSDIGFFGVGFKSVYEVTDRPRLYSDVFQFEIVDVSIPQWLGTGRPDDLPDWGTVLVLPAKTDEGERSPASLYERALELDPWVLFPLPNIDTIEFRLDEACDGGPVRRAFAECDIEGPGRVGIDFEPAGERRHYAIERRSYAPELEGRAASRPDETDVMVGVRLEESGRPTPLEPGLANVYSFLPTEQDSGLRFFVQGHFDVPVDRERIDPESDWNRWILERVPDLLRTVVEDLVGGAAGPEKGPRARGCLEVLPRREELNDEVFGVVAEGLSDALADTPLLPCTGGDVRPPSRSLMVPDRFAELFGAGRIDARWVESERRRRNVLEEGEPIWCSVVVPDLSARNRSVARNLGVGTLDDEGLIDVVVAAFATETGGEVALPFPEARSGDLGALGRLFDALLGVLERTEREDGRLAALRLRRRLSDVALVPDGEGGLFAADEIVSAALEIRAIYGGRRRFVAKDLDPRCEENRTDREDPGDAAEQESDSGEPPWNRAVDFLGRLGVSPLGASKLVDDLERETDFFTETDERRRRVLAVLAEADGELQQRASELPLFETTTGELVPRAADLADRGGAILAQEGPVGEVLAELYEAHRPVVAPEGPGASLLRAVETPILDLESWVEDLERGEELYTSLTASDAARRRLHAALDELHGTLSARIRERLAEVPIWPDTDGRLRPLVGEERVLVPADESVVELLPDAPWLAEAYRESGPLEEIERETVDAEWIVEDLADEDGVLDADRWDGRPDRLREVAEYVARRAGELPAETANLVPELPLFADAEGAPGPLADRIREADDARVLVATPPVARVLDAAGYRVVERAFSPVVRALAEARLIDPADVDELIEALAELDPVEASEERPPLQCESALEEVLDVLADRLRELSPAVLAELPVFPTRGGGVRPPSELVPDESVVDLFAEGSSERTTYRRRAPSDLAEPLVDALPSTLEGAERVRRVLEALESDVDRSAEHPHLDDRERRRRFYAWLGEREEVIFGNEEVRETFVELRAFPTRGGRLLAAPDLVYDADLPELEIDWRPADEIPAATLEMLDRRLGIRSPDIEELVEAHLLPAHRRAAADADVERSADLVAYLSRRIGGWSTEEVRELVGETWRLADEQGRFRPADDLMLPSGEFSGHVRALWGEGAIPSSAYPSQTHPLLRKLGAREIPPLDRLEEVATEGVGGVEESEAVAVLLVEHAERTGAGDEAVEAFGEVAWVVDETGALRPPKELYVRSVEVETLIGDVPEAYADEQVVRHLDDGLFAELGFRDVDDVELEEVVEHLETASQADVAVRFALYEWLERELDRGRLDEDELVGRLGQLEWIYSDDEAYFHHRDVLGSRELEMFGQWRGYWSRGAEHCPRLCELFDIPSDVTPEFVADFFEDVTREVASVGGREMLERDPALRKMLLRCFAHLGELDREGLDDLDLDSVPIPARELRPGEPERMRLVRASTSTLFRSDTPTLESMFGDVGTLHLAVRGSVERSTRVDRFYDWLGLEPLSEAYDIEVSDQAGDDRTEAYDAEIAQLRGRFRALLAVLPRIRKQRGGPDESWLYDDLFAELVESGRIRAVDDLAVRYVLGPVGAVESDVASAFDPAREVLLVDTDALEDPESRATGLAEGILPCVYDGPDDEQLVDILVILFPRRTRGEMDAYLDRRHFPTAEGPRSLDDRLHARLQEMLDFGLVERLADRFPVLEDLDVERWRRRAFAEEVLGDRDEITEYVAAVLLDAGGLADPGEEVVEALHTVLTVDSIDDVPPELLGSSDSRTPESDESGSIDWETGRDETDGDGGRDGRVRDLLDDAIERQEQETSVSIADRSPDQRRSIRRIGDSAVSTPDELESFHDADRPDLDYLSDDSGEGGFWDSVTDLFGDGDSSASPQPSPPPRWSEPESNPFEPGRDIGPQMWVTPDRLDEMARQTPEAWIEFEPSRLGLPHRYALQDAGGRFDPGTQQWLDVGDVRRAWERPGEPTGEVVELEGRFPSGRSRLPIPLYGRLEGEPRTESERGEAELAGSSGGRRWVLVEPSLGEWARVQYEVRLHDVPDLGGVVLPSETSDVLFEPTLPDSELPDAVHRWLNKLRARAGGMSSWQMALAVQSFVRERYEYDKAFMERDSVRRTLADLEAGRGNHHLQVLHAAGSGDVLGRGICYELNIMIAELLRRVDVPSLVSTGWVFDRGRIDRPDHLFAMAVVGSEEGACLMPLDAATDGGRPIRPMSTGSRGERQEESASHVPDATPQIDVSTEDELDESFDDVSDEAVDQLRTMSEAVRAVHRARDEEPPEEVRDAMTGGGAGADVSARAERLRDHLEDELGDARLAEALVGVVRGDHRIVDELPAELEALAELGVVEARRHSHYRITVG